MTPERRDAGDALGHLPRFSCPRLRVPVLRASYRRSDDAHHRLHRVSRSYGVPRAAPGELRRAPRRRHPVLGVGDRTHWQRPVRSPSASTRPIPALGETWQALRGGQLLPYISIIVPMGILGAIASLRILESAAAAGDDFPARPSLNPRTASAAWARRCSDRRSRRLSSSATPRSKAIGAARRLLDPERHRRGVSCA